MHSSSTFHLEWSNHLGNMQAVLESLYMHQSLVDVTISCRDGILKAHKVILSACSPYFEAVFRETPCKHPVLILKGVSVREMQALLRFMYRGQVDVPEADLNTLVATACEFKVKGFAVDAVRGAGDLRPDSPSDHESENEALSERIQNRAASRGWKLKKSEKNCVGNKENNMNNLPDEMSVTPVIVEAQSLSENILGDKVKEQEENVTEDKKEGKDDEGTQKDNETSQKSSEESQPTPEESSGAVAGNSEVAPYRRETRYKGQKRVDVGIRSSLGRTRSVDKRESSSMGVEVRPSSSQQLTKKQRTMTVTHKMDLSPDSEAVGEDQNSNNAEDRNAGVQESDIPDMTISACASEDGPMQYVKIKAEAESAEEEEEEEEATADMFCIPHLQEMPDTDSLDPSTSAAEGGLDLSASQWAQPPVSLSGREQRNIPETPAEEGEGDMACPYCFTRCPKFSDLKRHMRLHTEDKPHECEFCSLAFARASHLARHRRTHTGERPFHCPDPSCERTFSRQDKLKLHTQRAHPNLPCDVVQSGTIMRIRGRRRIRDKNLPLGLRLGLAPPRAVLNAGRPPAGALSHPANPLSPAVISLPFGDTSYLTSLSLGQQRYSDLTISPVTPGATNSAAGSASMANSGAGAEELLKSVRQLGECTIQTLPPSKVMPLAE